MQSTFAVPGLRRAAPPSPSQSGHSTWGANQAVAMKPFSAGPFPMGYPRVA